MKNKELIEREIKLEIEKINGMPFGSIRNADILKEIMDTVELYDLFMALQVIFNIQIKLSPSIVTVQDIIDYINKS